MVTTDRTLQLSEMRRALSRMKYAVEGLASHDKMAQISFNGGFKFGHYAATSLVQLQNAKMWLGEVMKEISGGTPYVAAANQRKAGIHLGVPPEHDKEDMDPVGYPTDTHIVLQVDWLREECSRYIHDLQKMYVDMAATCEDSMWLLENLLVARHELVRARQYLGMMLGALRDAGIVKTIEASPQTDSAPSTRANVPESVPPKGVRKKMSFGSKNQ